MYQVMDSNYRYIAKLKQHIRINRVILYGSYAMGHPRADSDIDLVVFSPDFNENNPIKDLQSLAHATRGIDLSIEALAHRPEEFDHYEKGSFLHEIIRSGKVICMEDD
jgi:uncharacterized protein